jgi:hypothetical protein
VVNILHFKVALMQIPMRRPHFFGPLLTVAMAASLIACGGGVGGNTPSTNPITGTLGGVAAVGSPIANGAISILCASGSALATTTGAAGAWQISLHEQALPCAVQVRGGKIDGKDNTTAYHSIATAKGTANATPLTDLMVANLVGSATPATWFAGLEASRTAIAAVTPEQVMATWSKLVAALPGLTELGSVHPMATSFVAKPGSIADDVLAALQTAMDATGVIHANLLACAAVQAFDTPSAPFSAALQQAYAALVAARTQTK